MRRQTGSEQDSVLGFPLGLPPFDEPECLCSLTQGRFHPSATVVAIRPCRGRQGRHRGAQAGLVVPSVLLGRAHHPLARGSAASLGAPESGPGAAWTRRGWPGAEGLTPRVHAAMVADCGHHRRAATQEPMAHLGGAQAPSEAEHHLGPTFAAPAQMRFALQEGRVQGRHGGRCPPEPRLGEALPRRARRDPERFPPGLTAVAPHPGPLTPLGLGSKRPRGAIASPPQARVVEAGAGCRARALQIIPGPLVQLPSVLRGTGPPGPCARGLLGTAAPPTGAWHGPSSTDRHSIGGDGLGAAEAPAQGIEPLVDRAIADGVWPDLPVRAPWGTATVPPPIRA
jgi:hypothetical protein